MINYSSVGGLALRLVFSVVTAVIVSATAYLCAWNNWGYYDELSVERHQTKMTLRQLQREIEAHRTATGKLPAQLTDLRDDFGTVKDAWGRTFHYEVENDDFVLCSYGQDGVAGGHGMNAKLCAGHVDAKGEPLGFWEFTAHPKAAAIQVNCGLAGVLAFPLCLVQGFGQAGRKAKLLTVLAAYGLTAVFAGLAALVLCFLNLPAAGGH